MQTLITFDSTHHALWGEQIMGQAGIPSDTIPTPREITASCGLALCLSSCLLAEAIELLQAAQVEYRAVYDLVLQNGRKLYRLREEV